MTLNVIGTQYGWQVSQSHGFCGDVTVETLDDWMDGRISCRHVAPTNLFFEILSYASALSSGVDLTLS